MIKCTICKKRPAVVFITKIKDGKQSQEGLCLRCAHERRIQPVTDMIEQAGMTDEDLDSLGGQMEEVFEGLENSVPGGEGGEGHAALPGIDGNPYAALMNRFLRGQGRPEESAGEIGAPGEEKIHSSTDPSKQKDPENTGKSDVRTRTQEKKTVRKKKYLDAFGINLTDRAKEGRIDEVIGRTAEISSVIQILNRRLKNNPVLIGEPGVGKTAVAEGLAIKIASGDVPAKLTGMELYLLDMTGIIAGTQFRGQFESRMKGIIEEAKALGNIILVIDEIHNIMGAGEAEGAMNAANILKPALSRGEIQVVGTTTLNEYRKHIEKDAALERRLRPVIIDEPSVDETVRILKGIRKYYEKYHRVIISDEALKAAAELSERYITDRCLPDKAIDVIDEAGSRANLDNTALSELELLKKELKTVQEEKESAVSADSIEDYQKAADLKVNECRLTRKISEVGGSIEETVINAEDIAAVIELWTKVPVQKITELESSRLINLEERIHRRIIGQDAAVSSVARSIRRARAGLGKKKRPSSFIFIGPTGTGKTELVKALAEELFESEEAMIRLDMSEYMEKHTVSKMIGSPPGYIGYDDGGQLTEKVRRKPYSVIMLDEIEKAHPDVFNMLLQILEDGRLTDSRGRVVNFTNTLIIMTSNAGTSRKAEGIGFGGGKGADARRKYMDVLKDLFRPEFLNRIDEIVVFDELSKEDLKKIIEKMLSEMRESLRSKSIKLEITEKAKEFILEKGYSQKYGARPLRRAVQRYVEDIAADKYLRGEIKEGDTVVIDQSADMQESGAEDARELSVKVKCSASCT